MEAVRLACALGLLHAAFSLYWALGGRWLLNTVGKGPEEALSRTTIGASGALLLIALFKALAAVIPMLNAQGRLPWPRLWRTVSWTGGIFLLLYGGGVALVSWVVLLGIVPSASYDQDAMRGHAFLWDPLFFLWGAALVWHLWTGRRRS